MRPFKSVCAGCRSMLIGDPEGDIWCKSCKPTVAPFTVELSDHQRRRLESLAVVRGVTPEDIVRLAIDALTHRPRDVDHARDRWLAHRPPDDRSRVD